MRQDPTFKDIFAYGFMVEELLRWFVAGLPGGRELVEALDFSKLLRVQEQSTSGPSARKRSYANDIVWRVPFRDRPAGESESGWLHLILMIEVQGTVDHLMALRVRNYVDNHHMELWRGTRFGTRDRLAPVLPIVIYTGKTRWTAARRVIDLVTPSAPLQAEPDLTSRTSELITGDGYLTLNTLRVAVNDLPRDNAAALLAGICNPTIESLPVDAAKLRKLLGDPDLRPLLEIVLLWAQRTAQLMNFNLGADDMAVVDRLHESGELEDYLAARGRAYQQKYRAEGIEQGIERGIEQGIEQGLAAERDLLRRQAARKFDPRTAERLADLLADIADSEGLAAVGDLIIDCAAGEELIARLRDSSPHG
ncbi:MAG: Rpn family recombination-promoting nuclease/putative transposase [Gammaproteobacteria bacterium]|nr:Rpn family recombination-promoting nuclease/putative transposase [Gammaproteobacteria bacterium]